MNQATDAIPAGWTPEPGQEVTIRYPFRRQTTNEDCPEFGVTFWQPGTRYEFSPPDDVRPVADGEGTLTYTVVSLHKPGPRYPLRVFYKVRFTDPDGVAFGAPRLFNLAIGKFRERARGYSYGYNVVEPVK